MAASRPLNSPGVGHRCSIYYNNSANLLIKKIYGSFLPERFFSPSRGWAGVGGRVFEREETQLNSAEDLVALV